MFRLQSIVAWFFGCMGMLLIAASILVVPARAFADAGIACLFDNCGGEADPECLGNCCAISCDDDELCIAECCDHGCGGGSCVEDCEAQGKKKIRCKGDSCESGNECLKQQAQTCDKANTWCNAGGAGKCGDCKCITKQNACRCRWDGK